ncbi:pectate lyase family protein [Cellulomonas oligotrophica]|uniref:Pectate lyase n=2 Tax=Cellulomonas oligotrophica TaxID=931536 RepID=A0A7Y9FEW9_9CELL|nr:pectate lyase [Cellulomonas oligotrophica]NYD85737.1 pectate lyase [Cellulomonas oligotrophica]
MRRPLALRLLATGATMAVVAGVGVSTLVATGAQAAPGGATGYASQNGGTTGGAGGKTVRATTGTQIHEALCSRASASTPIIIEVAGTITPANTAKVSGSSCNTAAGVIELKQISNVSIVGVGTSAVFNEIGIHIRESSNIIIQNVTVKNVKKSGSPISNGGDAISMETNVRNVWVDHSTLEASGGESEGFDGLFDMKSNTQYVTLSYSILRNSGRGGLIGSSETDRTNTFITFHHNLYENIDSRAPLLRGGVAHMYNNHYVSLNESGINSRAGAKAKVENNYFEDSKDVLGTFYTAEAGTWQVAGNIFDNVTWTAKSAENNPAGPNPTSTTTVTIPYAYTMDSGSCVPTTVRQTAGAGKNLAVSNGACSPTTTAPTPTATATATPKPTATATATAAPTTPTTGTNLSLGAGADGSGRASGTSYANVTDGSTSTYWSPSSSTGRVSVKWDTAKTIGRVVVKQASGGGTVTAWRVVNNDTGKVLASGTGTPSTITFTATSLKKVNLEITGATGTPRVAEVETYAK